MVAPPVSPSALAVCIQLCFAYSSEQGGCGPVPGLGRAGRKNKITRSWQHDSAGEELATKADVMNWIWAPYREEENSLPKLFSDHNMCIVCAHIYIREKEREIS